MKSPGWWTLWKWQRRVLRARRGMSPDDIVHQVGEPSRIDAMDEFSVWYYDLGIYDGVEYSHRIAFAQRRVVQSYIVREGGE